VSIPDRRTEGGRPHLIGSCLNGISLDQVTERTALLAPYAPIACGIPLDSRLDFIPLDPNVDFDPA
jgi:hypothetical protein